MLQEIKQLLGIEDSQQDAVLGIIISNVESHLRYLLEKEIPESLKFIVTEIAVMRFNRLGSEGIKADSVEGKSVTFYDPAQEFRPYLSVIEQEKLKDSPTELRRGRVMFI
ncbi:phage head-tail connector protein [Planomicrobium okeanokoites]|uniref:Phage head-tail connector protein n=1 Tax=Planomicrobium okeanokoites TaxID=244 RepID=A0ABV7KTG7_PLAOK|nr:phage head-tail connector protein [Planomicrobium okeanokoites]TAA71597.1 phage head-tail connector protein [Planomicrobium okeanokoites]